MRPCSVIFRPSVHEEHAAGGLRRRQSKCASEVLPRIDEPGGNPPLLARYKKPAVQSLSGMLQTVQGLPAKCWTRATPRCRPSRPRIARGPHCWRAWPALVQQSQNRHEANSANAILTTRWSNLRRKKRLRAGHKRDLNARPQRSAPRPCPFKQLFSQPRSKPPSWSWKADQIPCAWQRPGWARRARACAHCSLAAPPFTPFHDEGRSHQCPGPLFSLGAVFFLRLKARGASRTSFKEPVQGVGLPAKCSPGPDFASGQANTKAAIRAPPCAAVGQAREIGNTNPSGLRGGCPPLHGGPRRQGRGWGRIWWPSPVYLVVGKPRRILTRPMQGHPDGTSIYYASGGGGRA